MADTFIIAGLGNPGPEYALTRHNVGFMVADFLADRHLAGFKAGRGELVFAQFRLADTTVYLVKPLTYMNLSGHGVRKALDYWNVPLERLLVVYDDYHLPFGKIRLRASGSDGGHKGMRSIIDVFGTEDIARLRVGIGQDEYRGDAVKFVLAQFSRKEKKLLPRILEASADAAEIVVREGIEKAMNAYNHQFLVE
ncbi:MAG: aminoacyl-tRNA hydrolase [candidate division KSB1 bacterium]|nr:aminoacyl-tRNA hydrolase [candidate division KSB1 bacterium]